MSEHDLFTMFPCDCGDHHYIRVDSDYDVLEFLYVSGNQRWPTRLKEAWQALRGREVVQGEVILDEATTERLVRVLSND